MTQGIVLCLVLDRVAAPVTPPETVVNKKKESILETSHFDKEL